MKKLSTYAISLALCGLLLFANTAQADSECSRVRGIVVAHLGAPAATCPTGSLAGVAGDVFDASYNLIGTTTACLTGQEPPDSNGVIRATLTHSFIFTAGELEGVIIGTEDRAVLSPAGRPGLYRVNNRLDITTGGSGHLRTNGIANFANGDVMLEYNGRICSAD